MLENVFQFIGFDLQAENKFCFRQQLYKAVLVSHNHGEITLIFLVWFYFIDLLF